MYNCSDEVKELFQKGYRQVAKVHFRYKGSTTDTVVINESNIALGGLTIDKYGFVGNTLEVGVATAAQLTLKINTNTLDGFNPYEFDTGYVVVEIGVKKWDAYEWENATIHYIPCGTYDIVNIKEDKSIVTFTALDRMIYFDKTADPSQITLPITVENLIKRICTLCELPAPVFPTYSSTAMANRLNQLLAYEVTVIPDDVTYRRLLQWCTFLIGQKCAYMDHEGVLHFDGAAARYQLYPEQTYHFKSFGSLLSTSCYECTGITYYNAEGEDIGYEDSSGAFSSTRKHLIEYSGCGIYDESGAPTDGVMERIAKLIHDKYVPFESKIKSCPWLDPYDRVVIHFEHPDGGQTYSLSYATHIVFTMNQPTLISCIVQSVTNMDYRQYTGHRTADGGWVL